jgi:hypothetical protein
MHLSKIMPLELGAPRLVLVDTHVAHRNPVTPLYQDIE